MAEFDGFIACCRPEMVLFDIGAHFGLFSLAAVHFGGPESASLAVDPSPRAIRMIRTQAGLNGVSERIRTLEACVGSQSEWVDMVSAGIGSGGYFVPPGADHDAAERTRCRSISLDSLATWYGRRPTHVKIDVEGTEASVLESGSQLLSAEDAPVLFLELHNRIITEAGGDPRRCPDLLSKLGFRLFNSKGRATSVEDVVRQPLIRIIAAKRDELAR